MHTGHLLCAEQLREAIGLDAVLFMPCNRSPHKRARRPASAAHRLAMVRLAVQGHAEFAVSDYEIEQGGVSYTIDAVRFLREELGPEVQLWLLMGMDAYQDIGAWKDPDEVAAECFFGVARRRGYRKRPRSALLKSRTEFVDMTAVDISSSDIRDRLAEGRSIKFLVPDAVEEYIRRERPYPLGI